MDKGEGNNHPDGRSSPESGGHHHHVLRRALKISLLFSVVAVPCLVFYHSSYPLQLLSTSVYGPSTSNFSSLVVEDKLESILRNASMEDKTVIVTTLNDAWAEPDSVFDLFLESFRIGYQTQRLLNHLLVIAFDQKAYARCLALHPHCFALSSEGINFSGEAYFMSTDYLKMMWRRIEFLRSILERGYNFIFTDADIMWFRDPLPRLYTDADFQIACDYFRGDSYNINNLPNGGFNYVKSNKRTIKFYKFWNSSRDTYPGLHDQDVLNKIKYNKTGVQIRFLDTAYFGGFCEPSKDFNVVCTMHANCCYGLYSKVHDLRVMLEDWKKYMALQGEGLSASAIPSSWSVPQNCSVSSFHPPKEDGTRK